MCGDNGGGGSSPSGNEIDAAMSASLRSDPTTMGSPLGSDVQSDFEGINRDMGGGGEGGGAPLTSDPTTQAQPLAENSGLFGGWEEATQTVEGEDPALSEIGQSQEGLFGLTPSQLARAGLMGGTMIGGPVVGALGGLGGYLLGYAEPGDVGDLSMSTEGGFPNAGGSDDNEGGGVPMVEGQSGGIPSEDLGTFVSGLFGGGGGDFAHRTNWKDWGTPTNLSGISAEPSQLVVGSDDDEDESDELLKALVFGRESFNNSLF